MATMQDFRCNRPGRSHAPTCATAGRVRGLLVVLGMALTGLAAPLTNAAEFVVSNDLDAGSGSFQEAVALANSTQGPDTISFDSGYFNTPRTVHVDRLRIDDSLTIKGPGRDRLTIQCVTNGAPSGFIIGLSGLEGTNARSTVIEGLTLRAEAGVPTRGIFHAAHHNLTLRDVHVAGSGQQLHRYSAAVTSINAELIVEDSVIENLHSASPGGAVTAFADVEVHPSVESLLSIRRSLIRDNTSAAQGGAFYVYAGQLDDSFSITIEDSELSNNSSDYRAGAMFASGSFHVTLSNSTLSGNMAETAYGGALDLVNSGVASASLSIDGTTITDNSAGTHGGAISTIGSNAPPIRIANSVIAGNRLLNPAGDPSHDIYAEADVVASYSLIGASAGSNPSLMVLEHQSAVGSNILDTDPMLGPLADNGGATRTHAIGSGSPLLDAGNAAAPTRNMALPRPANDQRGGGFQRVSGPAVDIGAYERQVNGGGGSAGGSGGGSVGGWTLAWLALLTALSAWRRSGGSCRSYES
ncbi:MAG TPA: choice-of-anchor Q domain-containing protein [Woeseiaceae bacterium]|nr:choice-of-anchor Q domain-containing protein [Woeseiaceae bacterium]